MRGTSDITSRSQQSTDAGNNGYRLQVTIEDRCGEHWISLLGHTKYLARPVKGGDYIIRVESFSTRCHWFRQVVAGGLP